MCKNGIDKGERVACNFHHGVRPWIGFKGKGPRYGGKKLLEACGHSLKEERELREEGKL